MKTLVSIPICSASRQETPHGGNLTMNGVLRLR